MTSSFDGLTAALRADRSELERDLLRWQRWARLVAAATFALMMLLVAPDPAAALAPTTVVMATYALLVLGGTTLGLRSIRAPSEAGIPHLLAAADALGLAALVRATAAPEELHRMLLLGVAVVMFSAFYFGRGPGMVALVALLAAYALGPLVLAPGAAVGIAPAVPVALDAALFAAGAGSAVAVLGGFQARFDRFRVACKRAEVGDLAGRYDLDRDRLPDALTTVARSFNEMRARTVEQLGTDPLTRCLNRRAFETRLEREWRSAKRRGSSLALLVIDTDNFKIINDSYGHPVGDAVLQTLGAVMRDTARDTDVVARVGGDEFVVLLPDTVWQGALTFAERLRRNVSERGFGGEDGVPRFEVTLSIGVALARGTDPITAEDLMHEADRSLYKAKSGGRNRISA